MLQCKWLSVGGRTTKYFVCNLKNKAIDEQNCRACMMFLKETKEEYVINKLFGVFGGRNGR